MPPLLELDDLRAGYGRVRVLHGVDLTVPEGSVVALLGPNGVGKTTTLRAITGLIEPTEGRILLDGERLDGLSPYEVARRGVTVVPEGRGIFPGLSVRDNLLIGLKADRDALPVEREARRLEALERFPRLRERLDQIAGTLSGGEQQMLALTRAFVSRPRLLLMDEISMGLAPQIVAQLFEQIEVFRDEGITILLVEQFLTYALEVADLCYVMSKGRVTFVGEPSELRTGAAVAGYLGA